jgi:hypothetical protein
MSKKALFIFSLLGLLPGWFLFAAPTGSERVNYTITTTENPTAIEKLAADELQRFLAKSYSEPIILNGKDEPIMFFIGVSAPAILAGFTDLPDLRGKFGIFRNGRNVLLYGWDDTDCDPEKQSYGEAGTLLAVYYFLRNYVGIEFYLPGESGMSLTRNQAIHFPGDRDIANPTFSMRGLSLDTKEYSSADMLLFFRRSLCSIPRWAHPDIHYVYWKYWKERFFETHPEYFLLRDGKRISEDYPNDVPCFSNPDVLKQTVDDLIDSINKNPAIKTVKILRNSPVNLCECENCRAMPERQFSTTDSNVSEVVYGFQRKVAERLHQTHPNIRFVTQTKGNYFDPPKLEGLDDSFTVAIQTFQHFGKLSRQGTPVDHAKKWQAAGVRTTFFGYPRWDDRATKNLPVIIPRFTAELFRLFAGLSSGTATSELRGNPYSFSALNQFVNARLLFNVNEEVDELIGKFCSFAYPGAAEEVAEFYSEMETLFCQRPDLSTPLFMNVYSVVNLGKPKALLEAAQAKTKGESVFLNQLQADFNVVYDQALQQRD